LLETQVGLKLFWGDCSWAGRISSRSVLSFFLPVF